MDINASESLYFRNNCERIETNPGFQKDSDEKNTYNNTFPNEKADDPTERNGPYRLVRQGAHTRLQPLVLQGILAERFNSVVADKRASI
ncbi:hypothetical protein PENSUB_5301 [Penicillium subrubescens]|uniref:Uncharacterized protein n=1 Tax=Penicillium subrubescens TaxID=1316194 RepID=A0A1Q5UA45_9EURO|nr:hypothetical protein PENSUB_5301 [Penicillium subrubescens]